MSSLGWPAMHRCQEGEQNSLEHAAPPTPVAADALAAPRPWHSCTRSAPRRWRQSRLAPGARTPRVRHPHAPVAGGGSEGRAQEKVQDRSEGSAVAEGRGGCACCPFESARYGRRHGPSEFRPLAERRTMAWAALSSAVGSVWKKSSVDYRREGRGWVGFPSFPSTLGKLEGKLLP